MEEVALVQIPTWHNQLHELYPNENGDVAALAQRYLRDILHGSNSPVVVLVWKPSVNDLEWAKANAEIRLMQVRGFER